MFSLSSLLDSLHTASHMLYLKRQRKKNLKEKIKQSSKLTQKNKEIAMITQQDQASRFLKNMTYVNYDRSRNSKQFPEIEIFEVVGK